MQKLIRLPQDCLSSEIDKETNSISLSTGDCVSGSTYNSGTELWQHVGFASRPSNVTDRSDAAQFITLETSKNNIAFASRDVRSQKIYGQLGPGETALYASGTDGKAQGRVLLKSDGSVNLYSKQGNTESGQGMAIMLTPATNSISLLNAAGYGIIINDDGVTLSAKNACIKINADGTISITGKGQVQVDGTTIVLGSTVAPLVNAALKGPSGLAGSPSLKTLIE